MQNLQQGAKAIRDFTSSGNLNNENTALKLEELGGDYALFRQEYPATALEAFQTSGNPIFTGNMVRTQRDRAAKTPRTCIINIEELENVDRRINCWQIATLPRNDHQYCMGIDTMEGRLSDVQDSKSSLDCDAAAILDRDTNEIVAIWHGRGDQKELGVQCLNMAKFYNDAWTAPEMPHSLLLLNIFKEAGYENVYNRQVHDERIIEADSENLGWRTTLVTRKWLVDNLITAFRDNALWLMFAPLIDEMETFIRDKTGKPIHNTGKHDDLLFAAMIALQVHLRCPLNPAVYANEFTGEDPDVTPYKSLATSGVIDPGIDFGEDENEEEFTI